VEDAVIIAAKSIADVLGLSKQVHSLADIEKKVIEGLPKSALRKFAARLASDRKEQDRLIYRIVPQATYKRRKGKLKPAESERAERLARVTATAEYVWDDREGAHLFLTTPHMLLEGRRPIDVAITDPGARRVEQILWSIFYGLPA
jgi:putative toxin-antitoxin system antitoxin component (TIGR02293 family)